MVEREVQGAWLRVEFRVHGGAWECKDRVLDGPASGGKGSKGRGETLLTASSLQMMFSRAWFGFGCKR